MKAVVRPLPRGTDLGRLDPACTAEGHGTYTAYRYGCRCPHAREARRLYMKRRREGRAEERWIDACGVRRRIQALWAIGHTSIVMAEVSGGRFSASHLNTLTKRDTVTLPTAAAVADIYRRLVGRPGVSQRTRDRAARAGWPSPLRWGASIDDPQAAPEPVEPPHFDNGFVDEVAVERVLAGEHLELTDAELIACLQMWVARGKSLSALTLRLGLNYAVAKKLVAGELPPAMAKRAARGAA